MAITISGENNNDKILASDGVIDSLSNLTANLTGDVTGNLIGNVTGNVTGNINNTTLLLQTGGYERIRITSDGKIGIGTDAGYGDAKLTVEGTAALTNNDTTLQIKDNVNDSAAGRGGNIGFSGYVNGTQRTFAGIGGLKSASGTGNFSGDLALYTRVNGQAELDERLRIASDGKVGIGTNNPSTYSLHVLGGESAVARFERGGGAWAKVDIKAGTSAGNSYLTFSDPDNSEVAAINYEHDNDTFRIETWDGSSKVHRIGITTNGNVGINDSSPERTLDVVGNNAMIQIEGSGGNGKQWSLCSADNTTGANVGSAGMFAIYNDTDGVAALRVSNSNYVLRPKLPYFYATLTPSITSNYIHSFGNVHGNNGNHYNNSLGRFVAPVTGFYWFSCGIWCNSSSTNTAVLIQLARYSNSAGSSISFAGANHRTQYNSLNCSGGTYMEANDYVWIQQTGVSIQPSTPRNFFSGYLVG